MTLLVTTDPIPPSGHPLSQAPYTVFGATAELGQREGVMDGMAQGQGPQDYVILEKQLEATAKMRTASAAMIEALRAQRECNGLMEAAARAARQARTQQAMGVER